MLKMCQAIANLEITVECVLPGRVKKEIGLWFIECGFAPWPKGEPPRFRMFPTG